MTQKSKLISLPVRDFAMPVPRTGSIESHSGYGRAAAEGQEIHLLVQEKRAKEHSNYQAEVSLSHEFEREGYVFQVSGRMDGLFGGPSPKIEEIKTSFNLYELLHKLKDNPYDHPYCLQLRTYGYFYWIKNRVFPDMSFHLVSTRNNESQDFELKCNIKQYEKWLDLRLTELVLEAQRNEKRVQRRKRLLKSLNFHLKGRGKDK